MTSGEPKYKRVLLKLSGEALMGDLDYGHCPDMLDRVCSEISAVHETGVEICLVVGAGNIYRGMAGVNAGMERSSADYMGMLATVINALALQNILEKKGLDTRVLSAIPMSTICEPYIRRRASRHLERKRIVIFAAGTGNPYFTTDTAAALRASEMNCDALLKGTQVDGVYSDDPKKNPDAERYDELTYKKVLSDDLKVMDAAAVTLARENEIPIIVFSLQEKGGFGEVVKGEGQFTIIK